MIPWNRSIGVMEYWSVAYKDINPLTITPILQYSSTPGPKSSKTFGIFIITVLLIIFASLNHGNYQ